MKAIEFNGDGDESTDCEKLNKGVFHLEGCGLDYTICGETLDGDPRTAGSYKRVSVSSINCPDCVAIIKKCRGVKVIGE